MVAIRDEVVDARRTEGVADEDLAGAGERSVGTRSGRARAGHWSVPGVARTRVEAWAPTREGCIAEAVAGTVESFAEVSGCAPVRYHRMNVPAEDDRQMLLGVLDEVLFDISTAGVVPVWVRLRVVPTGVELDVGGVDTDEIRPSGRAPHSVSAHRLREPRGRGGWSASVVLARSADPIRTALLGPTAVDHAGGAPPPSRADPRRRAAGGTSRQLMEKSTGTVHSKPVGVLKVTVPE